MEEDIKHLKKEINEMKAKLQILEDVVYSIDKTILNDVKIPHWTVL